MLLVFISLAVVLHEGTAKHHHPIPTFFGRLDGNGRAVDRSSPKYNKRIESIPRINKISPKDAMSINLNVWPHVAKNGAEVSVLWSGISDPRPDDYIAYYCPFYDN